MKKKILIFILILFLTNIYSQELFFNAIFKTIDTNSSDIIMNEKGLCNYISYKIIYDNNGFIQKFEILFLDNDLTLKSQRNYIVNRINDNKISITCNWYTYSNPEYKTFEEEYIYKDNSWIQSNNEKVISYNKQDKEIQIKQNNEIYESIIWNIDKLKYFSQNQFFTFSQENGNITNILIDRLSSLPETDQQYIEDYKNFFTKSNTKINYKHRYDNFIETIEIETNYTFTNWKSASFNLLLFHPDYIVTPFILGFGNGFEFKEGVDYSGENEEPLKKNDETVEPVPPVTSKNNTPVIIIIAALLSILLVCTIIIITKKKKK